MRTAGKWLTIVAVAMAIIVMSGCGSSGKSQTAAGKTDPPSEQTSSGSSTAGATDSASEAAVPSGFPSEIPIAKGALDIEAKKSDINYIIHFRLAMSVEDATKLYKDILANAGLSFSMGDSSGVITFQGNTASYAAMLTIAKAFGHKGDAYVSIDYSTKLQK
ncbi:hypothetical protein [Cohnella soli]|uniref:Uncharacterized protein n=1 Tax=Cohnella soli TaxID=425005 RepID=A0ABW0HT51_9BACL